MQLFVGLLVVAVVAQAHCLFPPARVTDLEVNAACQTHFRGSSSTERSRKRTGPSLV